MTDLDQAEYLLCDWRVQPALNRVTCAGAEVRLEPRVMQVLACLLAADGEPVTRDALMQQVWGHEHVTEDALNRTVSKLRKLISDELNCRAEIETIPKTGYRLLQPQMSGGSPALPATRPATDLNATLRRHWRWIAALTVVVALVAVFWPRRTHDAAAVVTTDPAASLTPLTSLE